MGIRGMRGPPRNLEEVVYHILTTPGIELKTRSQVIIKEYLTYKFGAAIAKHPECEQVLEDLFAECVSPLTGPIPPTSEGPDEQ